MSNLKLFYPKFGKNKGIREKKLKLKFSIVTWKAFNIASFNLVALSVLHPYKHWKQVTVWKILQGSNKGYPKTNWNHLAIEINLKTRWNERLHWQSSAFKTFFDEKSKFNKFESGKLLLLLKTMFFGGLW